MQKEILKVPAIISKVMTMADKGLRLQVDTQELDHSDEARVMSLRGKIGMFVFAEQEVLAEDIKNLPKIELEEGEKAPSGRLRAVLYVYWEKHKVQENFDIFYRKKMEQFIDAIKEKINSQVG